MTDPTIRDAAPRDIPQIRSLIGALSAFHGDEATITLEQLQDAFFGPAPRARALVAEAGGDLIGYAGVTDISSLHDTRPRYDIHHLYVADGHRATGIGKALIAAAAEFARSRNALRLNIGTDPGNKGAQAAYRAMGLEEVTGFGPKFRIPLETGR